MGEIPANNAEISTRFRGSSQVANYMKKETENQMNDCIREVFEPHYGRSLSDTEVKEIRTNLMAYAEWLVMAGRRLYRNEDSLPVIEDGIGNGKRGA